MPEQPWGRAKLSLFIALVANVTGQSFLLLALPPLGRQMGFSDLETAAILSASALLLILAAPVWGAVSERLGRRPVILLALAGSGLGALAFGLITGARLSGGLGLALAFGLFAAARALQALFVGGLLPSAQAYMADITTHEQRVGGMGLIAAAYGLGAIGGALLAWLMGGRDPAGAFLVAGAAVAGGLALVFALVREPVRHRPLAVDGHPVIGRLWPFALVTLIVFVAFGMVQQVMALRLQDAMGFSPEESVSMAGKGLLLTALTVVAMQRVVARVGARRPERLLLAGALVAAASMLLCGLAGSYEEILAILLLFGMGLGLLFPGNLASLSLRAGPHAQGKAAGLNMMGQGVGLVIGPLSGALLHRISPSVPFFAAAALLLVAAGVALAATRRAVAVPL